MYNYKLEFTVKLKHIHMNYISSQMSNLRDKVIKTMNALFFLVLSKLFKVKGKSYNLNKYLYFILL